MIPNNDIYFSIIICCYNSEKYIEETIQSILNQTYSSFEIIIIDDGSKDKTLSIINNLFGNNINIKIFSNKNHGMAYSRNFAIDKASNEWIVILDHDDISLPKRLEEYSRYICKYPDTDLFFSDMIYFNNEISFLRFEKQFPKKNLKPYFFNLQKNFALYNLLKYGCFIGSSSVAFKKSKFYLTSGFNINYVFLSDYVFFLELSKIGNIFCIKKPLVKWRMHPDQSTQKKEMVYLKEMIKLYNYYFLNKNIKFIFKFEILYKQIIFTFTFLKLKFNNLF